MKRRRILTLGIAASAGLGLLGWNTARAQQSYPARPVRLVVPYPAGGGTDIVARKFAERLSSLMGQQVIIDNKPGAEAAIGAAEVAHAAPDGYTILFGTLSTHVITPGLMEKPGYDPVRDFAQIAIFGSQAMALVVNNEVPVKNLRELVAYIKASPGKYSYASSSSISRLTVSMLAKQVGGLNIVEIPYKGAVPIITDLLANLTQLYPSTMASVTSLQKSGRLRIFAVCTPQRVKSYPDIPTAIESGIPDMLLSTFNVVSVPARTPQAIVDQLARHATAMMRDEALAKDLEALGVEPHIEGDPAKVNAYVEEYRQRLKPLLKGV